MNFVIELLIIDDHDVLFIIINKFIKKIILIFEKNI